MPARLERNALVQFDGDVRIEDDHENERNDENHRRHNRLIDQLPLAHFQAEEAVGIDLAALVRTLLL